MLTKNNKIFLNKTKKLNKLKKFKLLKCAPKKKNDLNTENDKEYSCFKNDILFVLKENWNLNNSKKIESNDPKEIWRFLKKNMGKKCYNELCWLKNKDLSENLDNKIIKNKYFRPFSPKIWKKKPFEWLSSNDIIKVMEQYVKNYNNFEFLGPSPIDFDSKQMHGTCVWEQLCKFNLEDYYKKNINKIGIIFNLDPHYKSGSHWVALFIDLEKHFIFYFDSNGDRIPKQINNLVKKIKLQASKLQLHLKYVSNYLVEHQQKDGQCGMYTLYFIIELLKGKKEYTFFNDKKHKIKDDVMKNYRIKYYNN